jgi:hypothetical protein
MATGAVLPVLALAMVSTSRALLTRKRGIWNICLHARINKKENNETMKNAVS